VLLDNISVDEQHRYQGAGTQALNILLALADQFQAEVDLEVGCDEARIDLVRWYTSKGFRGKKGICYACPSSSSHNLTTATTMINIPEPTVSPELPPNGVNYLVANENTLGYIDMRQPTTFCVLAGKPQHGGYDWKNGSVSTMQLLSLRTAEAKDFEYYRVQRPTRHKI
jgi:hypothetical protein